jgi:hypothetical protein
LANITHLASRGMGRSARRLDLGRCAAPHWTGVDALKRSTHHQPPLPFPGSGVFRSEARDVARWRAKLPGEGRRARRNEAASLAPAERAYSWLRKKCDDEECQAPLPPLKASGVSVCAVSFRLIVSHSVSPYREARYAILANELGQHLRTALLAPAGSTVNGGRRGGLSVTTGGDTISPCSNVPTCAAPSHKQGWRFRFEAREAASFAQVGCAY